MNARKAISFHPSVTGTTAVRWPRSASVARAAGFGAVDVVLAEVEREPAAAVREALEQQGVVAGPASLPVEFRTDEETFRREFAELPRRAALAAAIGVRTMFRSLPASSSVPAHELLPTLRRRVSACARVLREHGIDFAVEVIGPLHRRHEAPHEFVWRLADGAEFAAGCDGDVGMLVDSWHWHHAGDTVDDIVALSDGIFHVHVADSPDIPADAVRDDRRLLPGEGIVDFRGFAEALDTVGYSRFVSPEIRGYDCPADSVACARTAFEAVQRSIRSGAEPGVPPAGAGKRTGSPGITDSASAQSDQPALTDPR